MNEATLKALKGAMDRQIAGDLHFAEQVYLRVLEEDADNPDANHLLGLVRGEQDRDSEAIALIEKAIGFNADASAFHHNIAGIYRRVGRLEEAESEFRRAIALKSDYGEAYQGLSEMVRFGPGDPLLTQIMTQLGNADLPKHVASYFHFAAGKILDDCGQHRVAFKHYSRGNSLTERKFDNSNFQQQVKETMYAFDDRLTDLVGEVGLADFSPIFVVGMPRSGTSLAEEILASHSQVEGAGELNDMKFVTRSASQVAGGLPWPVSMNQLDSAIFQKLARHYVDRVGHLLPSGKSRLVDKHPLNFQFVGLILLMFPKAKIVHTTRHPLDTCLSCFFQNFTRGQDYSFNLESLGHFYDDYRRLTEYWQLRFPDKILELSYESMLADQRQETERLLSFCNLSFEDACLNYHNNTRKVKTASFLQVRKPLYTSSRGRWKNYMSELEPLAKIIGYPLELPVSITLGRNFLG